MFGPDDGQDEYMVQQKVSYRLYEQEQKSLLRSRYPFLSPVQISRKVRDSWNRLKQDAKQFYTKSVLVKTPTKDVTKATAEAKSKKRKVRNRLDVNHGEICDPIAYGIDSMDIPYQGSLLNSPGNGRLQTDGSEYRSDFYSSPMMSPNTKSDSRELPESPTSVPPPHHKFDIFTLKNYTKSKLPLKAPKIIQDEHNSTQGILKGSRTEDTPKTKAVKGRVSFSTEKNENFQQSQDNNEIGDDNQDDDSEDEYNAMLIRRADDSYNFDDIDEHDMFVEEEDGPGEVNRYQNRDFNEEKRASDRKVLKYDESLDKRQRMIVSKKIEGHSEKAKLQRESLKETGEGKNLLKPTNLGNVMKGNKRKTMTRGCLEKPGEGLQQVNYGGGVSGKKENLSDESKGRRRQSRKVIREDFSKVKGDNQSHYSLHENSPSNDSGHDNSQSNDSANGNSQSNDSANGNSQSNDSGSDNSLSNHIASDNSQSNSIASDNSQSNHIASDNSQSNHIASDNSQSNHIASDNRQSDHIASDNSQSNHIASDNSQSHSSSAQDMKSPRPKSRKTRSSLRTRQKTKETEGQSLSITKREVRSGLKPYPVTMTTRDSDLTPVHRGETKYITPQMDEGVHTQNLREASKIPRKVRRSSQWEEDFRTKPSDNNFDVSSKLTKQKRRSSRRLAGEEEAYTEVNESQDDSVRVMKCGRKDENALSLLVDASGDAKVPESPLDPRRSLRSQTKQAEYCDNDEVVTKLSDLSSTDSWTVMDEEYNSELVATEDENEAPPAGQSDASKALVQALHKMKQAMVEETLDEGSSPKLLSPALSGISQMSSVSSDSSAANSQSVSGPGHTTQGPVSTDKAVTMGLCEMFGDMTPPEKRTSRHTRRLLASSNREAGSNFAQLFKTQNIFY